ncbi:acyl carrier protein [Sporofaciens sp. JLR.KK001]|uniref:acyl carrier protein n=1 Tax=Sporofaciens sp. JLR.KK001 TaxID=3112621 RepID=UPI002FF2D31A
MKITTGQIIEIIADVIQCNKNELDENSGIGTNAQWDSLRHVMIMAKLEELYGLKVSEDNIDLLMSVEAIKEYLNSMEL